MFVPVSEGQIQDVRRLNLQGLAGTMHSLMFVGYWWLKSWQDIPKTAVLDSLPFTLWIQSDAGVVSMLNS